MLIMERGEACPSGGAFVRGTMLGSQAIFVGRKMAARVYDLSDLPAAALSYAKE
jgi:hypothetical protein